MDLLLVNQQPQSCLSALGTPIGNSYTASDNCLVALKEIYQKLLSEEKTTRAFRRAIHFSQGLQNDIIPLLVHSKDKNIVDAIIRILVNLLVPVECLLPLELMSQTESGRLTIFELNAFLAKSKTAFRDPRTIQAIVEFMKSNMKLNVSQFEMTKIEYEAVNNCLLVLRNVLHIPENGGSHENLHNTIVWSLFVHNIDRLFLHLMTHEKKNYWSVALVQLIAVLFKDQHVGTLQKLLHAWFEGSLSESSEDNESNTPPDQRSSSSPAITSSDPSSDSSEPSGKIPNTLEGSSGVPHVPVRSPQHSSEGYNDHYIPPGKMLAFEEPSAGRKSPGGASGRRSHCTASAAATWRGWDERSNTSSGHSGSPKGGNSHHRPCQRVKQLAIYSKKGDSDYGYASLAETPEAVSTSSNEEESAPLKRRFHQKPHIQKTRYCNKQPSLQEKKEARRKKLMKRSKNTLMNIKAQANHVPRDEDIMHVLKEFTVSFLLTGYAPLVSALHTQLLSPSNGLPIDTSHFFWLLTYFLKFAGQLELDFIHVKGVLSFGVLSYLVYEGVSITEHVEHNANVDCDIKASMRRQHLVITAIREFILSIEGYDKVTYLSPQEKEDIRKLQNHISSCQDLKYLFALMLRLYRPEFHNRQYLEDLVVTNHIFLSFLEHHKSLILIANKEKNVLPISDHLEMFASVDTIKNYGLLLEDFRSNGEYLNDCVFTMMHHIAGDMNKIAILCQPNILSTFSQIWETDFQLCEDWSDLIEYVIHSFVDIPQQCPFVSSTAALLSSSTKDTTDNWSKEESENLYGYFLLSSSGSDLVGNVVKLYKANGVIKTRVAIIERLFKQQVITGELYKELKVNEIQSPFLKPPPASMADSIDMTLLDEISYLTELLINDGFGQELIWIEKVLLDTRHAKISLQDRFSRQNENLGVNCEPVTFYYSLLNLPVPVVCWDSRQTIAMRNENFINLLRLLGFHSPSETNNFFYRIPNFWDADYLLSVANKIRPQETVTPENVSIPYLETGNAVTSETKICGTGQNHQPFAVPRVKNATSIVNYTPLPNLPRNWLEVVKKSKAISSNDKRMLERDLIVETEVQVKNSRDNEDIECASVISVCDTQASDLTRMCISDEDEDVCQQSVWG